MRALERWVQTWRRHSVQCSAVQAGSHSEQLPLSFATPSFECVAQLIVIVCFGLVTIDPALVRVTQISSTPRGDFIIFQL